MARIGDYIDPSLNRYDPSPYLQAQGNATRTLGAGISNAVGDFGDKLKEQREKKNEVKAASKLIESYMTIYQDDPDAVAALGPIKDALMDEDLPVSERYVLGKQSSDTIAAYLSERESAANRDFQRQQIEMEGRRVGIAEAAAGREGRVFDANWEDGQKWRSADKQAEGLVAPALLEKYIGIARGMEESGQAPPISSATLQNYLQTADPATNIKVAEAFQSMLPQDQKPEFRDIPISIDGQPGTATAAYNPQTRSFDIVPVGGTATQGGGDLQKLLPAPLASYAATFEAAGAKYGVDPKFLAAISMHETGGGTSPAFKNKNNAMGISNDSGPTTQASVEASIDKMARELAKPGGYYDGKNTIGEIAKAYAPPKGATNDPKGLNQHWPKGVAKYYEDLGGNPSGSVRITAGAVKGGTTAKTPAELQKEQLEIQKLQGDLGNQQAAQAKVAAEAVATKAKTDRLLSKIEEYTYVDQKTGERKYNKRLDDAVGFGGGIGKQLNRAIDGRTLADQQDLERFVEQDLLEVTKDLKPVSEDEMDLLMKRRPKVGDKPEAWAAYMEDIRKFILEKTGEAAAPPQSASDRLRARINGQ